VIWAGKTIAVTGATGFIGRYLVDKLATLDCNAVAITRAARDMGPDVQVAVTDYSPGSLASVLNGVDAVIHLGGRRMTREDEPNGLDPFLGPNVALTGNLVDVAIEQGVKRFLLASTIAVYSPADPMPYREDIQTHPANAYALSKKFAENYIALKTRGSGMETGVFRLAAIYGFGEKGTPALMKFVELARAKKTVQLTGNPNHCIDQLYVRDAVSAFVAALEAPSVEGVYNIGCGEALSVEHIAETVNRVFGNADNLDRNGATSVPAPATYLNIARAREELGWRPSHSLEQGLEDFRNLARAALHQK